MLANISLILLMLWISWWHGTNSKCFGLENIRERPKGLSVGIWAPPCMGTRSWPRRLETVRILADIPIEVEIAWSSKSRNFMLHWICMFLSTLWVIYVVCTAVLQSMRVQSVHQRRILGGLRDVGICEESGKSCIALRCIKGNQKAQLDWQTEEIVKNVIVLVSTLLFGPVPFTIQTCLCPDDGRLRYMTWSRTVFLLSMVSTLSHYCT